MITITSNINDVINSLVGKIDSFDEGGSSYNDILRISATTSLSLVKTRVFEQGTASDGSLIGNYSKNPIYISFKGNPGRSFGSPTGKTGKSVYASGAKKGEKHRSKYYEGGYNEFKTDIGRNQLGSVNLSLSGQMSNQLTIIEDYAIGWQNAEFTLRAGYLEKKYGKKIFDLTDEENKIITIVATEEAINAFS